MKTDAKFRWLVASFALILSIGVLHGPVWAQSGDDQGRISYTTDDALLRGEGDEDWSFAGINTLILPGDRVWADNSGAVEVELPYGYFVRLADGSELEVVSMPRDGFVRGWIGSFYVQRTDYSRGDLVFETPSASFDFERETVARIDVNVDGATTLSVIDGRVGVYTGNDRTMDVSSGYRVYIDPGFLPSNPERIYRGEDTDSFDRWNRLRADRVADDDVDVYFRDEEYRPIGVRDLNDHGNWIYVDNRRYWRPSYVHGFVPYRHGRWSYTRHQGHVWVGHHPFSYVTSHYGYWHHHRHHGWIWSYDRHYAPSRVVTFRRGDLFLWAPANRYGYPVHSSVDFSIGDFNFSYGFTSYAHANHVIHQDHHAYPVYPYAHNRHHGHHGYHNTYYWRPHHDHYASPWWGHHHYKRFEHRRHVPTHFRRGPSHHHGYYAGHHATRLTDHRNRDHFYISSTPVLTRDQRRTIHRRIARHVDINQERIEDLRDRVQRVNERRVANARTALDSARRQTAPDTTLGSRSNPRPIQQIQRVETSRAREQQQALRDQAVRQVERQREVISQRAATTENLRQQTRQVQRSQRTQVQQVQSRIQQNQTATRERIDRTRAVSTNQQQQISRQRSQATQRVAEQQRATVQRQRDLVQQRNNATQRATEQRRNAVERQREHTQQRNATAERGTQQRSEAASRAQQQQIRASEAARAAAQARQQQVRSIQQRSQQINAQRSQSMQQLNRQRQQAVQRQRESIQGRNDRDR